MKPVEDGHTMDKSDEFACNSSGLLSEDQFLCSICLDVLTDPVSTPCGHNFCKTCLTQYWNNCQHYQCPLCKEKFTKRPELKINTTLREVVDHFKTKSGLTKPEVLCDVCTGTDHKNHNAVPIEEESAEKKSHLAETQAELQQLIQNRLKKIEEIKHSVGHRKKNTEEEIANSVKLFTALIRSIERSQAELLKVMEEKQKAAEKQADDFIKELEQEITKLKRRDTELEQLSHTEDHLHLLQIYPSLCKPPHTKNWTDISIDPYLSVDPVSNALSELQKSLDEELCKTLNEKLKETVSSELKRIQQYAVDVTLDADTAHSNLILSNDGKQVTHGDTRQNLPENPKRFTYYAMILGKEGFSLGKFYYEVQVRGKTKWELGVARESINRKGEVTLRPEDGFWTVVLRNGNKYKACAVSSVSLFLKEKPQKVGVFVDYEEGLVSFYDVESRSHIYSFTGQSFTEKLYPYFSPCNNDKGKNSDPLIITPVFKAA
ncbi:hypothetical protein SRHO_G00027420 [Serrasalmus rhombeus]